MILHHSYENVSQALRTEAILLRKFGDSVAPRGQNTLELIHHSFEIENPTQRHILVTHRYANPFATIAETLWALSGRNDLDWLERYIPQCKKWSDDGKTWRAAYGPRLRNFGYTEVSDFWTTGTDQIAYVIEKLKSDPFTRQAVIGIWDASEDTIPGSKDYPCNNWLQFLIRDGKLHLSVVLRSNDIIHGFSHNDFYLWSVLQELVANCVGVQVGTLTWFAGSFHVYERHFGMLEKMEVLDYSRSYVTFDVKSLKEFDDLCNVLYRVEIYIRNGYDHDDSRWQIYNYLKEHSNWFASAHIMLEAYDMKLRGKDVMEIISFLDNHLGGTDMFHSAAMYLLKDQYQSVMDVF